MSGKPSLKAEIYEAVLSDIIQGIYKQNEIITEKQLIAKYGVSKSPIRDALIELCKEGVLISHPRYGYVDVEGHLCIIRCMEEGRFDQAEQALKKDIASFLDIICPNYARTFNL